MLGLTGKFRYEEKKSLVRCTSCIRIDSPASLECREWGPSSWPPGKSPTRICRLGEGKSPLQTDMRIYCIIKLSSHRYKVKSHNTLDEVVLASIVNIVHILPRPIPENAINIIRVQSSIFCLWKLSPVMCYQGPTSGCLQILQPIGENIRQRRPFSHSENGVLGIPPRINLGKSNLHKRYKKTSKIFFPIRVISQFYGKMS